MKFPKFYSGQKVVYRPVAGYGSAQLGCTIPPTDTVLIIDCFYTIIFGDKYWAIVGYKDQGILEQALHPIHEQCVPLIKLTEILKTEKEEILINN